MTLLSIFLFPCFTPDTFLHEATDIQKRLSEYQWPLQMKFNFSHLAHCFVLQNIFFFLSGDHRHAAILPKNW